MTATNPTPPSGTPTGALWQNRWQRFSAASVRGFHAYANWLVGISWRRFIVLALGLIIVVGMVHDSPPFTWRITENIEPSVRIVTRPVLPQKPPKPPKAAKAPEAPTAPLPGVHIDLPKDGAKDGIDISIGKDGVHITPKGARTAPATEQTARAPMAASAAGDVHISVPPGPVAEAVREALADARREMEEAVRQARADAEEAVRDAEQARRDAQQAIDSITEDIRGPTTHTTRIGIGDFLMQFATLWVLASAVLKYTYKGRMQAEVKAAQATETAEAESLKRQVVEARMAAMQAQVEPHFLFNTLASIDHLIETDPPRASQMQKNLIALLRASMPTMREANGGGSSGVRDLGREIAVIRPYLEILKVRMEERLSTEVLVPDGLLSAEFPPMMIQTLVENAIKHGLEPKPEGGTLRLVAEIVHGKLQVTVADTGLGFGRAATAGTGVGLANIRERLQLLYGPKATLTVTANQPSGTVVTITVPYKTVEGTPA
jgi:signal transduction histidine kinase